jgi:vitamin K-dependent gamma-carboxylase
MTERLFRPLPLFGMAAFRALFAGLLLVGELRYLATGWISIHFGEPTYFFKYLGLEWVPTWSVSGVILHHSLLAVLAVAMLVGWRFRASAALYCVGFAFAQAMDATNYLNHYYQVVLLTGLLSALPLGQVWGLDARRLGALTSGPAWMLWLLRGQVAVVYLNASAAKVGSDWLLYGQPMDLWLAARADVAAIAWLGGFDWMPLAMSWAGFLFDLTIVGWLLFAPTRRAAYAAVLLFHGLTAVLFDIGLFPWIMILSTTLFFAPDWPLRLLRRPAAREPSLAPGPQRPWVPIALGCWFALQILIPLRSHLVDGQVLWHEQGMRFSWRVMVREKHASLNYRVVDRASGRTWQVNPKRYLTWRQVGEMSPQPLMVAQFARHIAADFERRRGVDVAVYADVLASLNGRPPVLLIDPAIDLTQLDLWNFDRSWILPAPTTPPPTRWLALR